MAHPLVGRAVHLPAHPLTQPSLPPCIYSLPQLCILPSTCPFTNPPLDPPSHRLPSHPCSCPCNHPSRPNPCRAPLLGRQHPPRCRPHLQPPSLSEWNPGRQRSHFQPVTVALQVQVPESSHWRRREPGGGGAQGSRGRDGQERPRPRQPGPLTCRVAVAGLAGCRRVPAIEVLPAVLAARPGRVVAAAQAAPPVARAAEELRVEHTLVGAAAAVASCGQGAGLCQWPWHVVGVESVPISLCAE